MIKFTYDTTGKVIEIKVPSTTSSSIYKKSFDELALSKIMFDSKGEAKAYLESLKNSVPTVWRKQRQWKDQRWNSTV